MKIKIDKSIPDFLTVDGKKRPTINSKKEYIHHTVEGIINFWRWYANSKLVNSKGCPIVVYHGTTEKFSVINVKKGAQNLFWFTDDYKAIKEGESGASGNDIIMPLYVNVDKVAGWDEYEKFGTGQLYMSYNGVILKRRCRFDGFVFDGMRIKSVNNKGSFDPTKKSIYQ